MSWSVAKRILRGIFVTLAGLFMAVVVLGAAVWGWSWYQDERLERRVSATRAWEVKAVPLKQQVEFELKTRCVRKRLLYQLKLRMKAASLDTKRSSTKRDELLPAISPLLEQFWREIKAVTVTFQDADGFEVIELPIPPEAWTNTVDAEGNHVGGNADGNAECDREAYASATKVGVGYNMK